MDSKELKEIIAVFRASGLEKMTLETADCKLTLEAAGPATALNAPAQPTPLINGENDPPEISVAAHKDQPQAVQLKEVRAPLVGIFYRAPGEDAEPYVNVGDKVKKGQTLFILEAMKMLNYIEAPCDGIIRSIKAENAVMAEFDQVLMEIQPDNPADDQSDTR
jgi:acetyl-CoA carboxylase biotin carboxyl carrier protein